jgi:hypothetical protein
VRPHQCARSLGRALAQSPSCGHRSRPTRPRQLIAEDHSFQTAIRCGGSASASAPHGSRPLLGHVRLTGATTHTASRTGGLTAARSIRIGILPRLLSLPAPIHRLVGGLLPALRRASPPSAPSSPSWRSCSALRSRAEQLPCVRLSSPSAKRAAQFCPDTIGPMLGPPWEKNETWNSITDLAIDHSDQLLWHAAQ